MYKFHIRKVWKNLFAAVSLREASCIARGGIIKKEESAPAARRETFLNERPFLQLAREKKRLSYSEIVKIMIRIKASYKAARPSKWKYRFLSRTTAHTIEHRLRARTPRYSRMAHTVLLARRAKFTAAH